MKAAALFFVGVLPALAQYSVERDGDVIRLLDGKSQTVVSVMPSHGNSAFDMRVKGKKVLQNPYASPEEYKRARGLTGIPFLAPWANRLDTTGFYANGKKYTFNLELGTVLGAPNSHPIHGFLTAATQWEVVEAQAGQNAAWVTSRLEFYRQPDWTEQAAAAPEQQDPFGAKPAGGGDGLLARHRSALDVLKAQGIPFPEGTGANFNPNTGTLVVRNTQANIDLITEIVSAISNTEPIEVVVRVTMISVEESRLKELGFDWLLSDFSLGGRGIVPGTAATYLSGGPRGTGSDLT